MNLRRLTSWSIPPFSLTILIVILFGGERLSAAVAAFQLSPRVSCLNSSRGNRQCDDFWVIDSRNAPSCGDLASGLDRLRYLKNCADGQLKIASATEFRTAQPMYTVFYVHGNGQTKQMAIQTGRILFKKLQRCANVPFRFVVWSWNSKGKGPRRGVASRVRLHAEWANSQGYYVAHVVSGMSNAYPVNLMGFSLGTITTSSALHLLAGGQIDGRVMPNPPPPAYHDLRCVHLAGAMDNDLLLPGRRYDQAIHAVTKLLVTVNPNDRILRFWPKASTRNQMAIGRTGIPGACQLGPSRDKLQYFYTSPYVGKTHSTYVSLRSTAICSRFAKLFFAPPVVGITPSIQAMDSTLETAPGDSAELPPSK